MICHLLQEDVPVLYFFFRHTLDTNNRPEALLRDWLAQVLRYSPPLQHELSARDHHNPLTANLPLEELWRYLRRALMYLPKVYCVVDAMDEMDPERAEALVKSLDALGRWRPAEIKLAVTSRPVAIIQKAFSREVKTLDVRLDKKRVEGDIARYIQHRLNLSSVPSERHSGVENAVLKRADGLFLYAKLALDLFLQSGAHAPLDLAEMPKDLTKMYANLLIEHARKTAGAPEGSQEFVLQLVTHATRPLRLIEIVDIVRLILERDDTKVTRDLIRALCGPLIEILPDETVRIVHHSLTEFLKGTISTPDDGARIFPVFDLGTTHHRLTTACLSYLTSGCLDSVEYKKRRQIGGDVNYTEPASLNTDKVLPPFTRYAGSNWATHLQRAASAGSDQTLVNSMLDDLLVVKTLENLDVLINTRMDFQPTPFHFAIALRLEGYAKHLLYNKKSEYVKNGRLEDSLILYAATKGSEHTVELLLHEGANPVAHNRRGRTPLHLAVEGDYTKIAAILMDVGVDLNISRGEDDHFSMSDEGEAPWTPLERVFARGSLEMAKVFYQRLQSNETVTKALYHAISDQNTRAISLLLQHPQLDVNAYYGNSLPLLAACANRDLSIIKLLLQSGAVVKPSHRSSGNRELFRICAVPAFKDDELDNVDFEAGIYSANTDAKDSTDTDAVSKRRSTNVLHAWAGAGRNYSRVKPLELSEIEVARGVRLLLAHGADVHQENEKVETPLHLAHDVATIKALLEGGADPNAVNAAGETVLHVTHAEEILDVLLPKADLNLQTHYTKRTPLVYTLVEGYVAEEERIRKAMRLIENGADINAVDKYGNSALHLAVGIKDVGKFGIPLIKKLCSYGEDVYLKNYQGKSPLHMNAPGSGRVDSIGMSTGHFEAQIFQILIAAGADINARDSGGQTPLFQFVENGGSHRSGDKTPVFNTIIEAGADIDTVDFKGRSLLHAQVLNLRGGITFLEQIVKMGIKPTQTDHEGNTLLHEAAPKLAKFSPTIEFSSLIRKLIEMGVDPRQTNRLGRTPLHILASINPGSFDPSNSFTSHSSGSRPSNADHPCGIDFYLSLCSDLVDRADNHGVLPLHFACTFSEYLTIRLLEEGASPSKATGEGLTPLHLATRSRQPNIIGILLDKLQLVSDPDEVIAVLNAKDTLNRTALYYGAASGRVESFQLLFDAGAALNHDSFAGSPWNGCVDFEEELGNWSHQTSSDDRLFTRKDHNRVKADAGGIMVSDTSRFQQPEDRYVKVCPFPTERLDEILDILASVMPEDQISFVHQAIASAAEKSHDYTVECLLRTYERLVGNAKDDLDEKTQACLRRRQAARSALDPSSEKEALIYLMKSRDYGVVFDLLTPLNCIEPIGLGWTSILACQFARGGFVRLIRKAAFQEVVSKTEWAKRWTKRPCDLNTQNNRF